MLSPSVHLCEHCGDPASLRCGACKTSWYCTKSHQKLAWKECHKRLCSLIGAAKGDQPKLSNEAVESGKVHFRFLNARTDRNMITHGSDTHNVVNPNKRIREFIKRMGLCGAARMYYNDVLPIGDYGRCALNVEKVIRYKGGKSVPGWVIWEGKYVIEAEAHFVWVPPTANIRYVNVTPNECGRRYDGYFVPDVTLMDRWMFGTPSNVVWWK